MPDREFLVKKGIGLVLILLSVFICALLDSEREHTGGLLQMQGLQEIPPGLQPIQWLHLHVPMQ